MPFVSFAPRTFAFTITFAPHTLRLLLAPPRNLLPFQQSLGARAVPCRVSPQPPAAVFLLDQLLHAEPYVLALVAVVALAYAVAAFGLLVAFVGFLAVVNGGRGHLAYAILRGARRPGRRRWVGVLLACTLAAALAEVEALVMVTWVVLAPGLEMGEALAGANEPAALTIAAVVSTIYWVFAAVGLPLVLRSVRHVTHELFPRRRIRRHA